MAGGVVIKLDGVGAVMQSFDRLVQQIGDKQATSKVLVPAIREAMKPVLARAQANAPVDTGGLKLTLQLEARRPTKADRRSKYITATDTVIAKVTTAPGWKLKKMSEGKGLKAAQKRLKKMGVESEVADQFSGIKSDARAMAQEFGTARMPAHPYLRTALETDAQGTVTRLGEILSRRISEITRT
jgi:HK97 gp10 family phage protein